MSVDAANSLDVPQDELKAILGEVACDIHGCYVLKSSQNDPFRFVLSLSLSLQKENKNNYFLLYYKSSKSFQKSDTFHLFTTLVMILFLAEML